MDWPFLNQRELVTIHTGSPECLGPSFAAWGFGESGVASQIFVTTVVYIPFRISNPIIVSQLFLYNGATAQGHFDLGVYSEDLTRLVHTGSTAQVGTSQLQTVDVADITIGPGRFYLAVVGDASAPTIMRYATLVNDIARYIGVLVSTSPTFPLPSQGLGSLTNAHNQSNTPVIGLTGKALI